MHYYTHYLVVFESLSSMGFFCGKTVLAFALVENVGEKFGTFGRHIADMRHSLEQKRQKYPIHK